jgi:cytochrome P450
MRLVLGGVRYLDSLAGTGRYTLDLGGGSAPRLLVWQPELIAKIFHAERDMRLEPSDTLTPLVGSTSLLFANGPRHTAYRQVVGAALRGRGLAAYHDTVRGSVGEAVRDLGRAPSVALPDWTRALTLRIAGRIVLGEADVPVLERFGDWVDSALGSPRATLVFRYLRPPSFAPSPWRSFLRDRRALWQDIKALLEAQAAHGRAGHPALAAVLGSGAPPLGPLPEDELADQIISLLFAGHETTASALAWTLFWLERHPGICSDIRAELASSGADGVRAGDAPLLHAACQEALRLSPPATVAGNRLVPADRALADGALPAGARLTPCIRLVHHSPDVYRSPLAFDPQRFLGRNRGAHEYLPFGGGTRRCLGADLAMLELRVAVAAVLTRFDLRCLNPEAGVANTRGPAMGPRPQLRMAVTARR